MYSVLQEDTEFYIQYTEMNNYVSAKTIELNLKLCKCIWILGFIHFEWSWESRT